MDTSRNYIYITDAEQEKIGKIEIVAAGCGLVGQGIVYLARLGVKIFTLIDYDHFEPSNDNRQPSSLEWHDMYKVKALRDMILAINPDAYVRISIEKVNAETIKSHISSTTSMFFNTVDFKDSISLSDSVQAMGVPLILMPTNFSVAGVMYAFSGHTQSGDRFDASHLAGDARTESEVLQAVVAAKIQCLKNQGYPDTAEYMDRIISDYVENDRGYAPQLGMGALLIAAQLQHIVLQFIREEPITYYPELNILSTRK